MAQVPLISLEDLATACDNSYDTANIPGNDFDTWMAIGRKIEATRQKLAGQLIDQGSAAYQQNQTTIQQATANLNNAIAGAEGIVNTLAAFNDLLASLDQLIQIAAPLMT